MQLDLVLDIAEHAVPVSFGADRVDACIRPPATSHLVERLLDVGLAVIDGFGLAVARGEFKPFRHPVDHDDPLRSHHPRAAHCELADRSCSPHRNGFALFIADGVFRRHPASRKDVGQEQHLVVRQVVFQLDRTDIGVGHPDIFCLTAGIATGQMRIAEKSGRSMAHGRARVFRRAIRRIAQRIHFALAEPAFAAGYGEGHHHPVADLQPFDIRSDLDDFAHEFVA